MAEEWYNRVEVFSKFMGEYTYGEKSRNNFKRYPLSNYP